MKKYIGNRYAPLIKGQWDRNESYESLTVVINEGNSYTSKKAVPAGIDITNSDFWIQTGNYNAQVETLSQGHKSLKDFVDIFKSAYDTFSEEVNRKIENIKNYHSSVSVKNFGAVGDGITDDSNAIQRAFNEGKHVYFPEGEYLVTKTITVNNTEPITIFGEGKRSIITSRARGFVFELKHARGSKIKDLVINNQNTGGAIKVETTEVEEGLYIDNVTITSSSSNPQIYISNLHHVFLSYLKIDCSNTTIGIRLKEVVNCFVSKCVIKNCLYGILIDDKNGSNEGLHITDNLFYQNLNHIFTNNVKYLFDFNVSNNLFDYCEDIGLRIANGEGVKIDGNFFGCNRASTKAIVLLAKDGEHTNVVVTNNHFQYYAANPTGSVLQVNESGSAYKYNDIKITDNNVTIYKNFLELHNSSGVVKGNSACNGVSGNSFVSGTSVNNFIFDSNLNHGNALYKDMKKTHNIYGEHKQVNLTKNTYYEAPTVGSYILAVTFSNTGSDDLVSISLSKDGRTDLPFCEMTIDKLYTPLYITVPAGYMIKANWTNSTTAIQHAYSVQI